MLEKISQLKLSFLFVKTKLILLNLNSMKIALNDQKRGQISKHFQISYCLKIRQSTFGLIKTYRPLKFNKINSFNSKAPSYYILPYANLTK